MDGEPVGEGVERRVHVGTYFIYQAGRPDEHVRIEVTQRINEVTTNREPEQPKANLSDDVGARFDYADGRYTIYPWATITSLWYEPANGQEIRSC